MEKLQIGKIQGKYLQLEILLYLDKTQILEFLFHLTKRGRNYLVSMHRFIEFRSLTGYEHKENR